eukprot:CAMPEP_0197529300 /NCGR_PEP_ID=MMETSP1318-20131121/27950_1 /TAXON_ID=552666 /ORGANISM="Partenskyella glossopodia, Strain RCC365" /LENGTH=483 /DNA_ID=CAMNT_0043084721 /DNA_START=78 /DNA_END=1532 /DNA_ORIENTATION=+
MSSEPIMQRDAESGEMDLAAASSGWNIQMSFMLMGLCFSINHGCVTAVLGLATAELGDDLGGIQSGVLYVMYTMSALFVATSLVHHLGAKWSLVWGLGLYCAYVASFLIAVKVPSVKWPAAIIGSGIGGLAAGWLWTAQGVYFGRSCERYSAATNTSIESTTSWLASIFAVFYVGFEVVLRLAISFLYEFGGDAFVYTVFTAISVSCAVCMAFVPKEPESLSSEQQRTRAKSPLERVVEAGKLLATDTKMGWISGFEMMFGLSSSFMNFYINGTITKAALGKKNIGYMTAILPFTATVMAIPLSRIANSFGKAPVMIFGCANYLILALVVIIISDSKLESLGWGLVFLYILGGNGRAVFESTNKAMVADFFPLNKSAAFANVIITSGGASGAAFFIFPTITKFQMGVTCAAFAGWAIIGVFAAFRLYWAEGGGGDRLRTYTKLVNDVGGNTNQNRNSHGDDSDDPFLAMADKKAAKSDNDESI